MLVQSLSKNTVTPSFLGPPTTTPPFFQLQLHNQSDSEFFDFYCF